MNNKTFLRVLKYVATNTVFSASIYYGYVEGIEGAENLALLIAWFCIIVSFFCISDQVVEAAAKSPSVIPRWIDTPFDLAVVGAFAWFGGFWTAGFYILHMFLCLNLRENAKKLNEAEEDET